MPARGQQTAANDHRKNGSCQRSSPRVLHTPAATNKMIKNVALVRFRKAQSSALRQSDRRTVSGTSKDFI